MRKQIKQAAILSSLITGVLGAGACLPPPPGVNCVDGWCPESYRCASFELTRICINITCGDGFVDINEECDDGNLNDYDDCLQTCMPNTLTRCSNGVVSTGEECDDGNSNPYDSCTHECRSNSPTYLKASNTGSEDYFGSRVALSADGSTLAVGAPNEDSAATGIGGNQADNSAAEAGAVYVFTRSGGMWTQQAYVKPSNTGSADYFGFSVALSADGSTLAVGAPYEDSAATGIGGNQADNSAAEAGAVYVFTRSGTTWTQQAYVKPSNTGSEDFFGSSIALSADGSFLAVGAPVEDSAASGIGGNQADNSAAEAGAVYVFTRSGTTWTQQAYVKPSNTGSGDLFGSSVALSNDGSFLAVGAPHEDSAATGIGGNQADNSATLAGAVYVFTRSDSTWTQQAYVKSSNANSADTFGASVALSGYDVSYLTLAVGAPNEDSAATGINGNQADNSAPAAGAVYVFKLDNSTWTQRAYVKPSNTDSEDYFGSSVALSASGWILAVSAPQEASAGTGLGGNQADNSAPAAGAVYVFARNTSAWSQETYVKPSNAGSGDYFGSSVEISDDGFYVAVGAPGEGSAAIGIGGNQDDDESTEGAGAVSVFRRTPWSVPPQ